MKILRVIRTTNPEEGGPIEALLRTSEVLMRSGHSVEVVSLEPPALAKSRCLPFPIHALGGGIRQYSYNPRLIPWLQGNAAQYDAVVVHGLWNYVSVGSWRALRHMDVPYVLFTHGMLDPWFAHHDPFKHALKKGMWQLAEGRVLRDAAAVLFTSEEEKLRAREVFSGFHYNARVIRYGAAEPSAPPEEAKRAFFRISPCLEDRPFLVYLGRIHPKKGIDLLLHAFSRATNDIPADLHLVIAGPDQADTLRHLQTLAHSLGASKRVHWLGMLQGLVKWGALFAAKALILPSHQENFAVVVAEAMACSTPVLISDKVNTWREVQQSGSGLVAPDTLDGTECLLRTFFALSLAERAQMGTDARIAYEQYFSIDAAAQDLLSVVSQSLHAHPQSTDPWPSPSALMSPHPKP